MRADPIEMGIKMKVLNLYAGIGGNRTHWADCQVTAVENNLTIASFYKNRFPNDTVVVGDAHTFLLERFRDFDFIWASPPCQSHSRSRFWAHGKRAPVFPDMKLYEEILFLTHYSSADWIVENVTPFYEPLVEPARKVGRHLFWSSRPLPQFEAFNLDVTGGKRSDWESHLGFSLGGHKFNQRTDQILRNCVHPEVGRQVFSYFQNAASGDSQQNLFELTKGGE